MSSALAIVSNTTAVLTSYASTLETQLNKARNDLNEIKTNCSSRPFINETCASIDTSGLKQEANFTTLPNVDGELSKIQDILNQNFSGSVDEVGLCIIFKDLYNFHLFHDLFHVK